MSGKNEPLPTVLNFITGSLGALTGWMFVHPFDLVKVRSQLVGAQSKTPPSSFAIAKDVAKNEGFLGFYDGIGAAALRQISYGTVRLGVYQSLRDWIIHSKAGNDAKTDLTLTEKLSCGFTAGGVGAIISVPVEVALVRMQADGRLPVAERRGYSNAVSALVRIGREEGVRAYFRGSTPTVIRAMVVNMLQIGLYDHFKSVYKQYLSMKDGVPLHFLASLTAGIIYCVATLPIDTCKTRMQTQKPNPETGILPYRSLAQTLSTIAKNEGVLSLWRGLGPYCFRGAGHTIFMFIFVEQYIKLARWCIKRE